MIDHLAGELPLEVEGGRLDEPCIPHYHLPIRESCTACAQHSSHRSILGMLPLTIAGQHGSLSSLHLCLR